MASTHRNDNRIGRILSVGAVVLVLLVCVVGVAILEDKLSVEIEHAGQQMTAHTSDHSSAQVFMNDGWYAERNVETLLVIGIDELGTIEAGESYNNTKQADFLALFIRDLDSGRIDALHLNRDTITDIPVLGVTGQATGTRRAQLTLAYNYGKGDHVSSRNVADAVERLLYGMKVDDYITVTMDAVPIINDWAGGVTVKVMDDFTGIDDALVQDELVMLKGRQALTYVRSRMGLDDSSNLHRMERQRQYASAWAKSAHNKLTDKQAVADLAMQLDAYYRSSCTLEKLQDFAQSFANKASIPTYEIKGTAVQGDVFMEFYVDEEALQQLVLELFYKPAGV